MTLSMRLLLLASTLVLPAFAQLDITTPNTLPSAVRGEQYSVAFAINPSSSANWSVSAGTLPPGVTFNPDLAILSGTPTVANSYTFSISVTVLSEPTPISTTESFTLRVNNPLVAPGDDPVPGAIGVPYSFTLGSGVTGGQPPYTYAVLSGQLPPGLTLSPAGQITGTPAGPLGTSGAVIGVTDNASPSQSRTFDISILILPAPLVISTTSLGQGVRGFSYSQALSATGGISPYTWSLSSGQLPPGLTISTGGLISGTVAPSALPSYTFTVRAQDNQQEPYVATRQLTIQIVDPVTITTQSVPAATVGVPYTFTLAAQGGRPPYVNWRRDIYDSLPPGLTLSAAGVLSGTPTARGTYDFTVLVDDSSTPFPLTGSRELTLTVRLPPLTITTPSPLPPGRVGVPYSATFAASGGAPPYINWVATGNVPPGLTLNPSTGVLSGTPTAPSPFSFTVAVSDVEQNNTTAQFALTIAPPILTISTTGPLPEGEVGVPYSATISATGGTPAYLNWSMTGTVPPGLSINQITGVVSGIPTASGTYTPTFSLNDSSTISQQTASRAIAITIRPSTLVITTTSPLPNAQVGSAYSVTFAASGGAAPYSNWTIAGGTLPAGLTLNPSSGVLSGTPTSAGDSSFTVSVRDQNNVTATQQFALRVLPSTLTISTASPLPPGRVATPYSAPLAATGGVPPYVNWRISAGTLPAGLSINPTTGLISGTPTATGLSTFTVAVSDSGRTQATAEKQFSLTINSDLTIITGSPLPSGEQGVLYNSAISATGGTRPYAFSIASGGLPPGVTLAANGQLSGTPGSTGAFRFVVVVRDANQQQSSKDFVLDVGRRSIAPLEITTRSLPDGTVGIFYGLNVFATGGVEPYTFAITGLPPGVQSNAEGGIFGTPTTPGTYPVRVTVTDANRTQTTATYSVIIRPEGVEILTTSLGSTRVGSSFSATVTARGGVPPYIFGVTGGTLPPGLTISQGGVISGTPTQTGTFSFTVQATDAERQTGGRSLTITVNAAGLEITTNSIGNGTVGRAYSVTLVASGGSTPYRWALGGNVPPGLSINAETGEITGTPTTVGTFTLSAQVTDAQNQTSSRNYTVQVFAPLEISTVSPLPAAQLNAPTSYSFAAAGGQAPYTFTLTSGSVPGLSFSGNTLSGTPTTAGTFSITVQATDANRITTSKSFTLTVGSGLNITTTSLPPSRVGASYSNTLTASGGVAPLRWSATGLPPGLSIGAESGVITGTPTQVGQFTVAVEVQDAGQPTPTRTSSTFTITIGPAEIAPVAISGLPATPAPAQQPMIGLTIGSSAPVNITGTMSISFTPNAVNNAVDPAIQFSNGQPAITFTIPANGTQATFPTPNLGLSTGTVAGTITITTQLTAGGAPVVCSNCPLTQTIVIPRSVPAINNVRVSRTANGFNLIITGFSTTRDVTRGVFRFTGSGNLQTSEVILPMTDLFNTYYRGTGEFGGLFVLTMPFVINGDPSAVTSVQVILSNAAGDSAPATATL